MKIIKLIFLLFLTSFLTNCAYYCYSIKNPVLYPIDKKYNIKDTPDIKVSSELSLAQINKTDALIISDIKNLEKENSSEAEKYIPAIKDSIYKSILRSPHNFIIKKELNDKDQQVYKNLNKKIYRLDITITYFSPGNKYLRYFIGYFGCGGVFIQIEGNVVDVSNNKTIMSYVICEKNAGNAHYGLNFKVFSDKYCFNKAIKNLTDYLVNNVVSYI